ncbi:MAG: TonB-dependent receptor [Acidobacteria bacterium]|nr:TonB-dependent receptor [Acidobacteriota bacterium]
MRRNDLIGKVLIALFVMLFAAISSMAQVGSSAVKGLVTDPQGNIVAGATVRLISELGTTRTAVTNDSGSYSFTTVTPGNYTLEVEMTGFKKANVSTFKALVDNTATVNVTIQVGDISETVNVSAAGLESIVNTQDASVGNNFVARQILSLPLEGRNVANLLSLQPGVTPDGSVTGGRSDQANLTLDGIDVNNQQNAEAFESVLRVNPDSVDEFRVTTLNSDASKGRSSGAQISLITKSGTNEFSGALYEYHRNTVTTANDWFNNAAGIARPKLIRNLFGGRIGGPIVKDRFFFFYNYEGMREAKDAAVTRMVPTASLAAGSIRFDDNTGQSWTLTTPQINSFLLNGVPVIDVNPTVVALFASAASRYPVNDTTVGDGRNTGGFRFNAPVPVKQNMHTARFDWNVTRDQKHTVSFRGNYQQDITGAAPYLPDTPPTNFWSHPFGFAATYTWLVNANLTNRFSYGMTRLAYSTQGDSNDPAIWFRSVFQPVGFDRAVHRTNPTHNFTDDMTWIKGDHTFQFGTNIRLISNTRVNYANSFDQALTNYSWSSANLSRNAVNQYITAQAGSTRAVSSGWGAPIQHALFALFGRLNDYGANFNFKKDGSLLAANQGIKRIFKTEEYDFYVQDSWKLRQNLTVNLGLRYGLSMPVHEAQGYEVVPSIPLGEYLDRTITAMANGQNYREPISIRMAGKANGKDSIYPLDTNNWQPRLSAAWSPNFEKGWLAKLFGGKDKSVFRGGFAMTNDYFGQQLAVRWDTNNELGFSTTSQINANQYNITTNPGVPYTGPSMNIRSFPNLIIPANLTFPLTAPESDPGYGPIQRGLDQNLQSPVNYTWSFSYGRELPAKIWLEAGYQGRLARHLLTGRDAMMLRGDIKDPVSGLTYFQAATLLDIQLQAGASASSVTPIGFFENMWAPGSLGPIFGCPSGIPNCTNTQSVFYAQPWAGDWAYMASMLDDETGTRYFFQGQYDSLAVYSTVGESDYHGAYLSIRQRLGGMTWDFNYTFSKSLDESSGLQTGDSFGSTFVLNAFHLRDQRSYSDFDLRHVINFNGVWDVPLGRGRKFGKNMNKFLDVLVGGWTLSNVFRWDSGYPFDGFYDGTGWQTNWNVRSYMTMLRKVKTGTYKTANGVNLFADPAQAVTAWRTPHPGETGSRNAIRMPGTWNIDLGIAKSFNMPYREGHKLTVKVEAFNLTNTPFFSDQSVVLLGYTGSSAPPNFGAFTSMANQPRVMQFAVRYDF